MHGLATLALVALLLSVGTVSAAAQGAPTGMGGLPMSGKVVLVTGSTDGLGKEVALRLGEMGAHVIVHGRNADRGRAVVAEIESRRRGTARFYAADLASFAEVRALAERVLAEHDRLDVLVNNAGVWLEGPRRESEDGHELHFQVNYLSGYLLTRLLLPRLQASAPARVVNVASGAQQEIDFGDVMLQRGYSDSRAYAQSKLAQIMFTVDLAAELAGTGVSAFSLHPATFMDTGMVLDRGLAPRSSVDEGADAVVHLVTAEGLTSGTYFDGTRPARASAPAYDESQRARLRTLSEALTRGR